MMTLFYTFTPSNHKFARDSHLCNQSSRWLGIKPFTKQEIDASLVAKVMIGGAFYRRYRK